MCSENRRESIILLLESIKKQLLAAQAAFDIWEQLWPTQDQVSTLNAYRGFFVPTRDALLDRFFIRVSNVIGNDIRSPSFYMLFSLISKDNAISQNVDIPSLRRQLRRHKRLVKRILAHRHTVVAHEDITKANSRSSVQYGEAKSLLIDLQEIFNRINSIYNAGNIWHFHYQQHKDASRLLADLKELWEQRREKYE
jgi:hypothetical protein